MQPILTALYVFLGIFVLIFFIGLTISKINKKRNFNELYGIKKGDSIEVLKNKEATPLIISIDKKTKLFVYQYHYWIGFIRGGTKTKSIVFTINSDIVEYITYN